MRPGSEDSAGRILVTLVSTWRPDLLGATLDSFSRMVLDRFNVAEALVNLDPAFGDESDRDACIALVKRHLPQARINIPARPGFGQAIKWLWSQAEDLPVLHMEDDWVVLHPIQPQETTARLGAGLAAVVPVSEEHRTARRTPRDVTIKKCVRLLGLKLKYRVSAAYGTSPRFVSPAYARAYAALIDPRMDPEKQARADRNGPLFDLVRRHRATYLYGPGHTPIIRDIGRDWRQTRGIRKTITDGAAVWEGR